MKFIVNSEIFDKFDNPRIGITVVTNADNSGSLDLTEQFTELAEEIESKYGNQTISEIPKIAAWRDAYRLFGAKPKDYPSSIESLLKRVSKGNSFWGISPLVDIYNYVSLKHILPLGGEDTDKMNGDLLLTFATNDEVPVTVLGKETAETPKVGEVIYKDLNGTICRRWNWREVARTMLTKETKNCILVIEAIGPTTDEELASAQDELGKLVTQYCGGSVSHFVLNHENPIVDLSI